MWNLVSIRLEIVLVLVRDSCTVCTECTIGSEIILDAPDEFVGDTGHVESSVSPFGDSVSTGAR